MITLKKTKAAITGMMFFIAIFVFAISPQAKAAVQGKLSNTTSDYSIDGFEDQNSKGLLANDLIFAAIPSDTMNNAQPAKKSTYEINSLKWEQTADDFILRVVGDSPPTYTMYELFDPLRVIIDIADASMGATVNLPLEQPQGPVSLVNGKVLEDKEPFIARLEIFLNDDNSYTVERIENDIIVRFPKPASEKQSTDSETTAAESSPDTSVAVPPVAEVVAPTEAPMAKDAQETSTTENANEAIAVSEVASTTTEEPTIQEEIAPIQDELSVGTAITEAAVDTPPVMQQETQPDSATVLFDVDINHTPTETMIYLKADGAINNFKEVRLGKNIKANKPDRLYLDINGVKLAGPIETKEVGTAVARVRTASRKSGFRIVFDSSLDKLFDYSLAVQPDGLLMTVQEPSPATALIAGIMQKSGETVEPEVAPQPETVTPESAISTAQLTEPSQPTLPLTAPAAEMATTSEPQLAAKKDTKPTSVEDFAFAGYEKQRITVDFYKIDLHNVFRLFGEVSNLNIVVDEAVHGSLTLALNDVPWDFALDIILNLKDLQKEERFNTIVISPKSKSFSWPERTLDTIDFKQDLEVLDVQDQQKEAIMISKKQEIPETVEEAKKLIHQASFKEKSGQYEAALPLYEEAFKKWPDNILLAKKIAGLCLVNLSQNAKAVNYAKTALQINPKDYEAALQAAIGSARMKRNDLAKEYFNLAISGPNPSKEALASYSGFCEENQDFECALEMLQRHNDLHGDTLQTMVSRARILDKQGKRTEAAKEYRALLLSGYEIPPDLARFIKARVTLEGK